MILVILFLLFFPPSFENEISQDYLWFYLGSMGEGAETMGNNFPNEFRETVTYPGSRSHSSLVGVLNPFINHEQVEYVIRATSADDITISEILVLFGGLVKTDFLETKKKFDEKDNHGFLGDLWIYYVPHERWKFLKKNIIQETKNFHNSETGVQFPAARSGHVFLTPKKFPISDNEGKDIKFILFGGRGYNNEENIVTFGDLWILSLAPLWEWDINNKNYPEEKHEWKIVEKTDGNFPEPRKYHCGAYDSQSKNFFVFGGMDWEDNFFGDLWSFSLSTNKWKLEHVHQNIQRKRNFQRMTDGELYPGARAHSVSFTFQGSFFLFGGENFEKKKLNEFWEFKSGRWNTISVHKAPFRNVDEKNEKKNFPGARLGHTGIEFKNNFFVFGGRGYSNRERGLLHDMWQYDLAKKRWYPVNYGGYSEEDIDILAQYLENLAIYEHPGGREGSSLTATQSSIYLFGGEEAEELQKGDLWQFKLVCYEGYEDFSIGKCLPCPEGCDLCYNSTHCQMCLPDKFLFKHPPPGAWECTSSCHTYGSFYNKRTVSDDDLSEERRCSPCHRDCNSCINFYNCKICKNEMYIFEGRCVNNCESHGRYYSPSKKGTFCERCSPNCKHCNENLGCMSCDEGYLVYKRKKKFFCKRNKKFIFYFFLLQIFMIFSISAMVAYACLSIRKKKRKSYE